ncbi:MAG: UvrD-helicase domain-containing protein [Candidatus Auribacterota bacterium]|jgi:uncharacterized protein (TIGR00375 family)|nr:UvrD-helicase domain-containing protein [Candidatus Auribacterota bacterium]
MRFIADFHIHSHFSVATSKKLVPEYLEYFAKLKGITVVGTGDCVHPGWCMELKEKLEPAGNGLFRLKPSYKLRDSSLPELSGTLDKDVFFILTAEISSIYKKNGRVRKVHNLCVFPDFSAVESLQARLARIGNIASDGRPILGLDAKDLLEMQLDTATGSFLVPAHIWTPWFSVLGSKSGFDTIEECFEDLTPHIFALETGLSSDPPMNWACGFLDSFRLISNSDAHSPEKLGREANIFDTELSYDGIFNALRHDEGFIGTIEFFPQEGKYHYDGHRKCGICWDPSQTVSNSGICPVCGKQVTLGVMYRVAELADRPAETITEHRKDFFSITSLPDIIAEVMDKKNVSKAVTEEYFRLIRSVGPDFDILLNTPVDQIKQAGGELLAEAIRRLRNGQVYIQEGYDGEFGRITMFKSDELKSFLHQSSLFGIDGDFPAVVPESRRSIKFDIDQFKQLSRTAGSRDDREQQLEGHSENLSQQKAICHGEGVCMVIAGPGTGKTRVLTERIAFLIENLNVPPASILAVTFSNKAADEMRVRLRKLPACEHVSVMTFHSMGLSVLTEHCQVFGRSRPFIIADSDESAQWLADAGVVPKNKVKSVLNAIEAHKQGIETDGFEQEYFDRYESIMRTQNAFDLSDLLYLPVLLAKENHAILNRLREKYRWILIDEYQDINPRQYELITMIAGLGNPNLFVIGDPNQAIYGFRGSDVRFIDRLRNDYPDAQTVCLSRSYRCPSPVLRVAGQACGVAEILDGRPDPIKIQIMETETDRSEADFIAGTIESMMGGVRGFSIDSGMSDGTQHDGIGSFSDFAVLCRTTALFDAFINAFSNHGIPYQLTGAQPFYAQEPCRSFLKKLRDIYCESIRNERFDENSFKLTDYDTEPAGLFARQKPLPVIFEKTIDNYDIPALSRRRLISLAEQFGADYNGFFNALVTRQAIDDFDPRAEAVSLMTLHASKGLEFNAVFIPACEQGIIPFELFGKKQGDELLEEERLFYVGATRTKRYLYLTHAKKRSVMGRVMQSQRSSLLDRIDEQLLELQKRTVKPNQPSLQLDLFEAYPF